MACICGTGGQDWSAACTRHGLSRGDWIQQALIADKAAADLRRENARLIEELAAHCRGHRGIPRNDPRGDVVVNHCPACGATVRSLTRESGGRWSLGCGDWITDEQAAPILAERGDDT